MLSCYGECHNTSNPRDWSDRLRWALLGIKPSNAVTTEVVTTNIRQLERSPQMDVNLA
ncbi:hypothetical protein NG799_15980 [Laspinema sp. D1]|uniref:Uncharacterized protein n=1 Tax=Laspinema palackyanum D2a TaxID=2953684 RepID=A0ABT2MSW3_9CYAN|nr:hypothetical protein [Laspinema sp. D2a]